MRVAVAILVVALFAAGIGAPSVCAALCAGVPASAPPAQSRGHHDHHAQPGAPPDTAAVSATPCIEYQASEQVAMAPRPPERAVAAPLAVSQESMRAIATARAVDAPALSPPSAVPLPDPPLRI